MTQSVDRKEGECPSFLVFDTGHDRVEIHAVVATAAADKGAALAGCTKH